MRSVRRIAESGFNVPDGDIAWTHGDGLNNYPPVYHPLVSKKWMDGGAKGQQESLDNEGFSEEELGEMGWPDPESDFDRLMKSDDVAFIGNSFACHMGAGSRDWKIETDGVVTQSTTIVFE